MRVKVWCEVGAESFFEGFLRGLSGDRSIVLGYILALRVGVCVCVGVFVCMCVCV